MPDKNKNNTNGSSNQDELPLIYKLSEFGQPLLPQELQEAKGKGRTSEFLFDASKETWGDESNPNPGITNPTARKWLGQSKWETFTNAMTQFGANVTAAAGTGLINSVDTITSLNLVGNTSKDFNPSLFGISVNDLEDMRRRVASGVPVYELNPGSFNMGDAGWWGNQVASAGTGVGMAIEALLETMAITAATSGTGTIPSAISKIKNLPQLFKLARGAKTVEQVAAIANMQKNLRRTATIYAALNRLNESKMESQASFRDIYESLSRETNPDGSKKYSEAEIEKYASEGANTTFMWNMPLMALDILTYRTMVFNPLSGKGVGLMEKGFEKIAKGLGTSMVGKATAWSLPKLVGMASEGLEEGFQHIGSSEGEHNARVLAGLENKGEFTDRIKGYVQTDEFWNNFAGGVIGSPIIGGIMNSASYLQNRGYKKRLDEVHNNYVSNIGKSDEAYSNLIRNLEEKGDFEGVRNARRMFGSKKAIDLLHLDGLKDTDTGFDSLMTFYESTLDQAKQGNFDNLKDLGFENADKSQLTQITQEFQTFINDANKIKTIFDGVANSYDKRFVPEIVQQQFNLEVATETRQSLVDKVQETYQNTYGYTDLNSQGQELFKVMNDITAMEAVRDTLSKRGGNQEKIATLDAKIKNSKNKLKEIQSSEEYSDTMQEADSTVLNSILMKKDLIHDLMDIHSYELIMDENRDKLSKWNRKDYINERLTEAVTQVNSKESLAEIKEELTKNKVEDDALAQELENKRQELSADEVAKTTPNPYVSNHLEAPEDGPSVDNGGDPVEVKSVAKNLASIIAATTIPTNTQATLEEGDTFSFEPDPLKSDISDDMKNTLKNFTSDYVDSLREDLGRDIFFEDFLRDYIKTQGKALAEKHFNGLVEGWKANNFAPANYEKIYQEIFRDRKEIGKSLGDAISAMTQTPVEVQQKVDKAIEDVSKIPENIDTFDENNQPVFLHVGFRTHETTPKLAFTSRRSEQTNTVDEEGNVIVSWDYIEEGFNEGEYVKSLELLDPDKFRAGTKLTFRVPENYMDILVPVHNSDGTKGKAVKFGQLNLTPGTQEYVDKIPIIAYSEDGTPVAFVHDAGWYHESRFKETQPGQLQEAKANLREYREAVASSPNLEAKGEVVEKRETTFEGFKIPEDKPLVTLQEANPDSVIAVVDSTGKLIDSTGKEFKGILHNTEENFNVGHTYDIRRYGADSEGNPTYIVLPVFTSKLSEESQGTIHKVLEIYLNQLNRNVSPELRANHEKIRQEIITSQNLDIFNPQDLEKLLKMFIPTLTNRSSEPNDISSHANSRYKVGTPYIHIDYSGGNVVFGVVGDKMTSSNTALSLGPNLWKNNPSEKAVNLFINGLEKLKSTVISRYFYSTSKEALQENRPFIQVSPNGIQTQNKSYSEHIKSVYYSNMKSLNIGTEQNPKWVTNMQPIITFKINSVTAKDYKSIEEQAQRKKERDSATIDKIISKVEPTAPKTEIDSLVDYFNNRTQSTADTKFNPDLSGDGELALREVQAALLNVGAENVLAHGMAKLGVGGQFNSLIEILTKGLDTRNNGELYTAPLALSKENQDLASAMGTSGGTAYMDGSYILLGKKGVDGIKSVNDIGGILVNEALAEALPELVSLLQKAFPSLSINSYSNAVEVVNNLAEVETQAQAQAEVQAEASVEVVVPTITEAEINTIVELSEKELKWIGNINDEDLEYFEPQMFTEEQAQEVGNTVLRIAGLTPNQQNTLVHYAYQQVIDLVDFDSKEAVLKSEINKALKSNFETYFGPIKSSYQEKVLSLTRIYESDKVKYAKLGSVVKGYQIGLTKIRAIEDNFNSFLELTQTRINKYTGITETTLTRQEENTSGEESVDNPLNVEEEASKESSYENNALQEDGKSTSSYRIKRFFDGIRAYKPNGELAEGFLGLPEYIGFDTVYEEVAAILAESPSDFDSMMKKLEENVIAKPYLNELIQKLNGASNQIKNEFVSLMDKHVLNMEFVMYSYDRNTGNYSLKVMHTNANSITQLIQRDWFNNFKLKMTTEDGTEINKKRVEYLLNVYDSWNKKEYADVTKNKKSLNTLTPALAKITEGNFIATPISEPNLKAEVTEKLKESGYVTFTWGGKTFKINKGIDNNFNISLYTPKVLTSTEVKTWLEDIGINLSDETVEELFNKGMYDSSIEGRDKYIKFNQMFHESDLSKGLFGVLAYNLRRFVNLDRTINIDEEGGNPLESGVIKKLAKMESKYSISSISNSFRDNGKSLYGFTANKFITERVRDLNNNEQLREQLSTISYSKGSLWLELLNTDPSFRGKFSVAHLGLTAFKEAGKSLFGDNGITNLADADHELTKIGLLQDMKQGKLNNKVNGIGLRIGRFFSPNMSDKTTMTILKTAVLDLQSKDFLDGQGLSPALLKTMYEQLIKPELIRILNFHNKVQSTNIKSYDKGARMFFAIDALNNLEVQGHNILDFLQGIGKDEASLLRAEEALMEKFHKVLEDLVESLVQDKINDTNGVWKNNGYITKDKNGNRLLKFLDSGYLKAKKFQGNSEQIIKMTAMDFVINNLIATSNSFMLIAGDPANYYKAERRANPTSFTLISDTFDNINKRLANQVAPGIKLADSVNNEYIQIFIDDVKTSARNLDYLKKLLGEEGAKEYENSIEAADAQEYTTWKEHLYILEKLGRVPDLALGVTPQEIREAREIFSQNKDLSSLSERQKILIKKILQPLKPVYTGQVYDSQNDVMRVMYIKSSSIPLIPQLTKGLELDKLRVAMEDVESKDPKGRTVRASYQSANKVGAVANPMKLWNKDGFINEEALKTSNLIPDENQVNPSLVLPRSNFRIQQDVPFKSYKRELDTISLGTQTMKLLFGNGIMELGGFSYNGQTVSGKALQHIYNQNFIKLIDSKKRQLYSQLGIDTETNRPHNVQYTMDKIQDLLKKEAIGRGYPKQDIENLNLTYDLDSTGRPVNIKFNMPLWASSNSNRFESLLNSIVSNKVVKMKFPGYSFVLGSEEGMNFQSDLKDIEESKIIFSENWKGQLEPAVVVDGKLVKAQVLMPSKFRTKEGKLIDFTEAKYWTEDENKVKRLNQDMIAPELLSMTSFRIPTSGHVSMSQVEIVGFLPEEVGDVMVVPRNFTKQMGLDFDIDKQNTYMLHHTTDEDGKVSILTNEYNTEEEIQEFNEYYENVRKEFFKNRNIGKDIKNIEDEVSTLEEMGLEPFTESIKRLGKLRDRINPNVTEADYREAKRIHNQLNGEEFQQKLLTNEIIKIHSAVLSNPSNEVQRKIQGVLSMDYAKEQAKIIDEKINGSKEKSIFSPFSDEFQKDKMVQGASGKIGTGAYSLDVVTHSLFQQASSNGSALQLRYIVLDDEGNASFENKHFRFGNYASDGTLGNSKTISGRYKYEGDRYTTDVLAERQNVAVDNAKEMIMGRVNLNNLTLDVDKIFNLLGFDKGEDGNSIAFLFLSQPIIREYVSKMKNASATIAEYSADKEQKIVNELLEKYGGEFADDVNEEYWNIAEDIMSNTNMLNALSSTNPDQFLQRAVLRRFMEMKDYGINLRKVQTNLNVDSKGLGKSIFDVSEKLNNINKLASSKFISNVDALIGDFRSKEDYVTRPEGFIDIGDYYVKPTTLSGAFAITGLTTANSLWGDFFPYNTPAITSVFNEVIKYMGKDGGESSQTEVKQQIFKEIKKYLLSHPNLGLYTNNPQEERQRLFFGGENSLAGYLRDLKVTKGNRIIDEFIKSNKLLNKLEFDLNKGDRPSLIKFNNAASEAFDEEYLHNAFVNLMEKNIPLPDFQGKPYNTRLLAQDLVSYSYLEGGVQEAVQFVKYIPTAYLNAMGTSQTLRDLNFNSYDLFGSVPDSKIVSQVALQIMQHLPQKAPKIEVGVTKLVNTNSDFKANDLNTLETFEIAEKVSPDTFVSLYNPKLPKGDKKFQLYMYDGEKYVRVPVLGVFGMSEYNMGNANYPSLVNEKIKKAPIEVVQKPISTPPLTNNDRFDIESGNIETILDNIINKNLGYLSELAKQLKGLSKDLKIGYLDLFKTYERIARGVYVQDSHQIFIDPNTTSKLSDTELATTILHEFIHSLTISEIKKWENNMDKAPASLKKLNRLFQRALKEIGQDRVNAIWAKFNNQEKLTAYEKNVEYGVKDIYEFVTMIMVQPEFQQEMDKVKLENGETLWTRFVDTVKQILESLGVQFDENGLTFNAMNNVLEFINETQTKAPVNPFGTMREVTEEDLSSIEGSLEGKQESPNPINPFGNIVPFVEGDLAELPSEYRDVPIQVTEDIINAEGMKGAAQFDRVNNIIKVNRPLLQEKFKEKAWTNMRTLYEYYEDGSIREESKAQDLPVNQFTTYKEFEDFVIEHEYQHSIYSREDFDKEFPNKTKGDYETEINRRAIENNNTPFEPHTESNYSIKSRILKPVLESFKAKFGDRFSINFAGNLITINRGSEKGSYSISNEIQNLRKEILDMYGNNVGITMQTEKFSEDVKILLSVEDSYIESYRRGEVKNTQSLDSSAIFDLLLQDNIIIKNC